MEPGSAEEEREREEAEVSIAAEDVMLRLWRVSDLLRPLLQLRLLLLTTYCSYLDLPPLPPLPGCLRG